MRRVVQIALLTHYKYRDIRSCSNPPYSACVSGCIHHFNLLLAHPFLFSISCNQHTHDFTSTTLIIFHLILQQFAIIALCQHLTVTAWHCSFFARSLHNNQQPVGPDQATVWMSRWGGSATFSVLIPCHRNKRSRAVHGIVFLFSILFLCILV